MELALSYKYLILFNKCLVVENLTATVLSFLNHTLAYRLIRKSNCVHFTRLPVVFGIISYTKLNTLLKRTTSSTFLLKMENYYPELGPGYYAYITGFGPTAFFIIGYIYLLFSSEYPR